MNEVKIDGKITNKGVDIKFFSSGMAVGQFTIGRSYKDKKTEEWKTEFFDVKVFGKVAESTAEYAGKVSIVGYLKQERWESDGQKRSKVVIVANEVMPMEAKAAAPADDDIPF